MQTTLRKTIRTASLVSALAAALVPAAQAQDEEFIPGYTDFPNALRVESGDAKFVPGHSDFPNHLRIASEYDSAPGIGRVDEPVVVVRTVAAGGFDWLDAGIGAGGAASLILIVAGGTLLAVRRPTRRTALTG